MALEIRGLGVGDYKAYGRLCEQVDQMHREAVPRLFRKDGALPPLRSLEYYRGLLQDPKTLLLGAYEGGRLIGFAHAQVREIAASSIHVPRTFVLINNLVVDSNARRQGAGRAIFDGVVAWAQEQGASDLQLNAYEFNSGARAFYESLGFRPLITMMSRSVER